MEDIQPEGQTLVLDSSSIEVPAEAIPPKTIKATPEMVMKLIRESLAGGKMTIRQAQELRRQLGVTKNFFTKKKVDLAKKARKKKIAEASRRRNRYNGATKGQKIAA